MVAVTYGRVGRRGLLERIAELETHDCLLPGWTCPRCRAFNGDAKERLTRCRCCDAERFA